MNWILPMAGRAMEKHSVQIRQHNEAADEDHGQRSGVEAKKKRSQHVTNDNIRLDDSSF
jgi:hypothetical protein